MKISSYKSYDELPLFLNADLVSIEWWRGQCWPSYATIGKAVVMREREKEFLEELKLTEAQRKWAQRQGTAQARA